MPVEPLQNAVLVTCPAGTKRCELNGVIISANTTTTVYQPDDENGSVVCDIQLLNLGTEQTVHVGSKIYPSVNNPSIEGTSYNNGRLLAEGSKVDASCEEYYTETGNGGWSHYYQCVGGKWVRYGRCIPPCEKQIAWTSDDIWNHLCGNSCNGAPHNKNFSDTMGGSTCTATHSANGDFGCTNKICSKVNDNNGINGIVEVCCGTFTLPKTAYGGKSAVKITFRPDVSKYKDRNYRAQLSYTCGDNGQWILTSSKTSLSDNSSDCKSWCDLVTE